ncbi:Bacterial transcription activator, effector binding domain [Sporomusa ovata DSM 2662]|uniref:Transcriptional regulator, AraC family n=1 Tax=Sporomusa ovata TaxID=2378 RepID=A0A0U1L6J2_9FIRM|nr:GyrI-like domain-containing protein [Sporomusa ovata]EQB28430.1 transcription activator effector binding protein [Sporomusa ovata DSM 2662]CQR74753.1 Transcriptional regulator, AraC family [Sporomusa ovata]
MKNRIETIGKKFLVGKRREMSYINDQTLELWKSFMIDRKQIQNRVDLSYYSMQIYHILFDYASFNPTVNFTKWAAVEVIDHDHIPSQMDGYIIQGGTYAVFTHVGPASTFVASLKFIHEIWLPESKYTLDDREHFEILEEGYNPLDENATEEIWIPITLKEKD